MSVSVSVSAQDGIIALGKAHTCSTPPQSSFPKVALGPVPVFVWLRSFPTSEGGMSATSILHSSFLQAMSAVMLWPVHVQKVPLASEHLCLAKLQTKCDICCACQSLCPFTLTDSSMPRAVDPQKSLQPKTLHGCPEVFCMFPL